MSLIAFEPWATHQQNKSPAWFYLKLEIYNKLVLLEPWDGKNAFCAVCVFPQGTNPGKNKS
jgi:hypothetical protein